MQQWLWRSLWWIWLLSLLCWWCKDCEITKWQTKDWQSLWIYDLTWLGFIYGIWKKLLVGFSKVYVNIDTLLELLVAMTTLTHSSSILITDTIHNMGIKPWQRHHDNDTIPTIRWSPLICDEQRNKHVKSLSAKRAVRQLEILLSCCA